jgi:hypothetical protein
MGFGTILVGIAIWMPHADIVRAAMASGPYSLVARGFPIALVFALAAAVALLATDRRVGLCALIAICAIDMVSFTYVAPWRGNGLPPAAARQYFAEGEPGFGAVHDAPGGIDRWVSNSYAFRSISLVRNVYGVNGYDPLIQKDFADVAAGWTMDGYPTRSEFWDPGHLSDVLRVTTLIVDPNVTPGDPTWSYAGSAEGGAYDRYERNPRLPEVYLVGAVHIADLSQMAPLMQRPDVRLDEDAFVEGPFKGSDALHTPGVAGSVAGADVLGSGKVTVDAKRPALVVMSHGWEDGWHATVDGHSAPVVRVEGLVLGVPVPAGHHVIHIAFTPPGLKKGAVVSMLSAFGAFVVPPAVVFIRRRRRRETPARETAPVGTA